jgi:WD40 repeat protein
MQTIPDLGMNRPEPVFGPQHQLLLVDTAAADTGTCTLHLPTTAGNWQPAPDDVQRQFASACSGTIAVAFHAATSTLAVARDHAGVTLFHWQASPPALQRGPTLIPKLSARLIAFAPDGDRLLLSCKDRVVRMVDRANNVSLELSGHLGIVESLEFSPRGDRLLLAATDSGITVHDLRGRRLLSIQPQGTTTVARFLPAGDRILYADTTRTTLIVPIDREAIVGIARTVPIPPMPVNQDSHYRARAGDDRAR